MTRTPFTGGLAAAGLCLLGLTGCGGANMAPVSGTVKYDDGTPVPVGSVNMLPADDPMLPSASGSIQSDGTYSVYTAKPKDGARVGRYKVTVVPPGDDYGPRNPLPIDPKFSSPETSGLEFEVKPGKNTFDITISRPKKK